MAGKRELDAGTPIGGERPSPPRGHRDAKPRDGDAGISFPHFHASQYRLTKFLHQSGIYEGATFSAVLTPTEPNPWHSTLCGYWKPLATLLMLGHIGVTERSLSNLIGHVRTSGVRFDLAQLALVNQMIAHCAMTMVHHDPFLSFPTVLPTHLC